MAVKETLVDYLRKKKDESEDLRNEINWGKRRERWLNEIESLYRQIREWLQEAIDQNIVDVRENEWNINEEYVGEYRTTKLIVNVGADEVIFVPQGTMILGASGRVDMRGKEGTIMLVLLEQDKPGVVGTEWHITTRETPRRHWQLTKESFEDALKQVMG